MIDSEIKRLNKENATTYKQLFSVSVLFAILFWGFEPVMRRTLNEISGKGSTVIDVFNVMFNYVFPMVYLGILILIFTSILKNHIKIKKYKKDCRKGKSVS
ncbi:hypothetical protein COL77_30565 [Bacillus wiedmannii]|uniref:hypothetical protein n=1 Tax=Bacillus wiedmannii TaxID=1890302 RepID=UPI000BFA143E|nr:hypothetical protein [Bacillus wiedmannii]PFZ33864.1 hypothetical protein COL77_30565 [Bacillus wiedmannii]